MPVIEEEKIDRSIETTYDEESYSLDIVGNKPDSISSYLLNDFVHTFNLHRLWSAIKCRKCATQCRHTKTLLS